MHRSWGKPDANHAAIVAALRQVGVFVQTLTAVGDGCPDLLCSYRGAMTLVEVKRPRKRLRPNQERWRARWDPRAPYAVVETIDDAIRATTIVR